jgi:DNA-binding response OmpR family regulator
MPIANSEPILIVDDEQLVAETLKEGLERQGHRCLIAGTGPASRGRSGPTDGTRGFGT